MAVFNLDFNREVSSEQNYLLWEGGEQEVSLLRNKLTFAVFTLSSKDM